MSLKRCQVVERIDAIESTGVNKAHEQITDVSPVLSLEEEAALPMYDGPLEDLLAEVIVQRRSGNP